MIGILDVGGGMKGIYSSGIYDYLMDKNIYFDYNLGVSSGSANLINYVAKQRGRTYRFFHDYSFHKEYIGIGNFLKTGSLLGLDYIYSTICNSDGIDPLDYETIAASDCMYQAAATVAKTGKAHYFDKSELKKDDYSILKAACALPAASRSIKINGVKYFDGGASTPVPYKKAFAEGCDKLVVIIYYPKDYRKGPMPSLARLFLCKYPELVKAVMTTNGRYNASVDELIELEKQGKVLLIAPEKLSEIQTLTRDKKLFDELYQEGYKDGAKIEEFLKAENKMK